MTIDCAMTDGLKKLGVENVPGGGHARRAARHVGLFQHRHRQRRNGIHILENINTGELVRDQAWEFLLTLGPARITGGVQAIVNPIAIQ
jgi:hypothetical protein